MIKRDLGVGLSLAFLLAILIAGNLIASKATRNIKTDLTDEKLYTLSSGSTNMLSKLDTSVKTTLFFSKRAATDVPVVRQYSDQVVEMLKQFNVISGGKVTLEVVEPRPDTEQEEKAVSYGLRPMPAKEPLYFGLVATSETGEERSIPFLDPQRESFLEYDVAKLIQAVSNPKKKKLGILSALPVTGGAANDPMSRMQGGPPKEAWAFVDELKGNYDVQEIGSSVSEIDPSFDAVMVIHPKAFSEQTEYAIDQYILHGGHAIVVVDAFCEADMAGFQAPNPQARFQANFDSNLPKLLDAWGLELESGKVLGNRTFGADVNVGDSIKKYIVWMMLKKDQFNKDQIMTNGLEQVVVASAGALKKKAGAAYSYETLINAPEKSGLVDSFIFKLGADPDQVDKEFKPETEPHALAIKVTGKFKTAFPDGKPASTLPREPGKGEKDKKDDPGKVEHLAEAAADNTVIVISDADMFSDRFAVRVQNFMGRKMVTLPYDNLLFLFNAVEIMTGTQDLIGLRTRGKSTRPFERVDQLEAQAATRWKKTEDDLRAKLDETNKKIQELQQGRQDAKAKVLSAEQQKEIEKFQEDKASTMKELRDVRRNLRQEIESLGVFIKVANIAILPLLLIMMSFVPGAWRSYKVRSSRA